MRRINKQQFFEIVAPAAMLTHLQGSPILPSIRLAYSCVLTNGCLVAWHNLSHMRVAEANQTVFWQGDYVNADSLQFRSITKGKVDKSAFRAYKSIYHCYGDEDEYFDYKQNRQIVGAKSVLAQLKAVVRHRKDSTALVEQLLSHIQLYQLERFDESLMFFDKPSYVMKQDIIPVMLEDEVVSIAFCIDSLWYTSLWKIQDYYKIKVEQRNGVVRIHGHIVKAFTLDNLCFIHVAELQKILLIQVEWDQHANILSLY